MKFALKLLLLLFLSCSLATGIFAQHGNNLLTDMIDTTTEMGRGMLSMYNKYGHLSISGYLQPQFQLAQARGISSYSGGDFSPNSNSRFRLRRGRLRVDYTHYDEQDRPAVYFVLQFDGTERGVNIRDFWGRYYENKWQLFHFSAGMMARPFGFEILYSSQNRETPERGRMSQILMSTERDLGFMASFNPRKKDAKLKRLSFDLGVYNGQGLTGPAEFDSHKDVIGRLAVKQLPLKAISAFVSGGVSGFAGGLESRSPVIYKPASNGVVKAMVSDSAVANKGRLMPRNYAGIDAQIQFPHKIGVTEFRAEYVKGVQTGVDTSSATPGSYPVLNNRMLPLYQRNFDGAYFYFLQSIFNPRHQLVVKYDWYDPNLLVKKTALTTANGFTPADVRFSTIGAGYVFYVNAHLKLMLYYDHPVNEKTALKGFEKDVNDDVFTCRAQFSF